MIPGYRFDDGKTVMQKIYCAIATPACSECGKEVELVTITHVCYGKVARSYCEHCFPREGEGR